MASTQHTTAITEDGKYYAWGRDYHGGRGDSDSSGDISYPKYIDTLPNILAPSFEFDGYDKVFVNKNTQKERRRTMWVKRQLLRFRIRERTMRNYLKGKCIFTLKSATVPATKASGLYTWAFHHGNFDNAYGDGDILTARDNGRFYADTPAYTSGTITIGTITVI